MAKKNSKNVVRTSSVAAAPKGPKGPVDVDSILALLDGPKNVGDPSLRGTKVGREDILAVSQALAYLQQAGGFSDEEIRAATQVAEICREAASLAASKENAQAAQLVHDGLYIVRCSKIGDLSVVCRDSTRRSVRDVLSWYVRTHFIIGKAQSASYDLREGARQIQSHIGIFSVKEEKDIALAVAMRLIKVADLIDDIGVEPSKIWTLLKGIQNTLNAARNRGWPIGEKIWVVTQVGGIFKLHQNIAFHSARWKHRAEKQGKKQGEKLAKTG